MKPAVRVTLVFLSLLCVAHLIRLLYRVDVVAGGVTLPLWTSAVACLATAALAGWLWREQGR